MRMTIRSWTIQTIAASALLMSVSAAAADDGWIQAASVPPSDALGARYGFSAWLRASDVGAGAGGVGRETTILRVMSPAQFDREGAYKLYRINFRCRAFEYTVVGQTSYGPDGAVYYATEGDGLVRTYEHSGFRGVGDAVCEGVTPVNARTAESLEQARAVPQYADNSDSSTPED